MKDWSKFLETLAGKLTAILAFAVVVIVVLGLLGYRIPEGYRPLVYGVAILAMIIFAFQLFLPRKPGSEDRPEQTGEKKDKQEETPAAPAKTEAQPKQPVPPSVETEHPASQAAQPAVPAGQPLEPARQAYLQAVMDDFRPLSLAGMDTHSGDVKARLALEDIYIELNTTTQVEVEKGKKRKKEQEDDIAFTLGYQENRPLPVLEALEIAPTRRMVLLGFPGTGKSTFVRYLSLCMAQELNGQARKLAGWKGPALLPVAISLGRFAETLPKDTARGEASLLDKFLVDTLQADPRTAGFAPHLLEVLKRDGGLLLFDGLDEVADLELRPVVVQAVESFAGKYSRHPDSRFLVTCRTYSYQDPRWQLTGWQLHELALFTPEQIARFVSLWYALHTQLEPGRALEYSGKKTKLLAAVQPGDPRRLYEVAPFPIILTVMAIVHAHYELPDSRAQVYAQCVELLLEKWQATRSIQGRTQTVSLLAELDVPASLVYTALYEIAYEAHQGHEAKGERAADAGSLVTEGLVLGVLHEQLQDLKKEQIFLEYCQKANGLLMLRGTVTPAGAEIPRRVYAFPHLTFEEYLASRHMKKLGADNARQLFDQAHDRWNEAIKFLAEYLCFSDAADRDAVNGLLEAFSTPFPAEPREQDWRALWLAGELLALYTRAFKKPSIYAADILAHLRRLVGAAPLSMRERADAADVLDQLRQPEDLGAFQLIPGDPAFYCARYPVTNAQYECFLNDPDFAAPRFWMNFPRYDEKGQRIQKKGTDDQGWKWLEENLDENGKLEPRFWRDPRFGLSRRSAPVIGVSWYEANAYCKWLLERWQELPECQANPGWQPGEMRLPTDGEWSAAAGGEALQGRYPWDGETATTDIAEITRCANIEESGIGRTTPVWMYPQGASLHGVLDLAGNVWEWQASYSSKEQIYFSLRGGSWFNGHEFARVAQRSYYPPVSWGLNFGFRVVASPSE